MMPLEDDGSERSRKKKNTASWWCEKQKKILGAKGRSWRLKKDRNNSLSIEYKKGINNIFHKSIDMLISSILDDNVTLSHSGARGPHKTVLVVSLFISIIPKFISQILKTMDLTLLGFFYCFYTSPPSKETFLPAADKHFSPEILIIEPI